MIALQPAPDIQSRAGGNPLNSANLLRSLRLSRVYPGPPPLTPPRSRFTITPNPSKLLPPPA